MNDKKVVSVAANHVEPGIKKYGGKVDTELNRICQATGLNYTVYVFADERVLLVLPNNLGGLLYADKETMLDSLSLEK